MSSATRATCWRWTRSRTRSRAPVRCWCGCSERRRTFPEVVWGGGPAGARPPLPFTPGIELCGEVAAAGAGVTGFAAGDRVIGSPALPSGGYAELALMNADTILPAPDGLDDAEAAAFFITYQTGWFGLHRRARLAAGETLLVQ